MLSKILKNKKNERKNMHSNRSRFRTVFVGKNAKIIGEIKPKKPLSEKYSAPKIIAERLLVNPDIAGYSILIDREFFGGSIENIELVRASEKPTLFKEFVYETSQIDGASYYGYDAVLLIKKIFPTIEELKKLVTYCLEKNIEPLVEVDNRFELEEVLQGFSPEEISIGINCRDLDTMQIDRKKHFNYWRDEMKNYHTIALSGLTNLNEVIEYQGEYDGVVIGTLFTAEKSI